MKLLGITLMWVGALLLLKNVGLLRVVDASIVWPVIVIILGTTLKQGYHHGRMCGMMGMCKMCKGGDEKVCDKCGK